MNNKYLENIYNQCVRANWNTAVLTAYANKRRLKYQTIMRMAKAYAINYLGMSDEAFEEIISQKDRSTKKLKEQAIEYVKSLLCAKTNEEVIRLLSKKTYTIDKLRENIKSFLSYDLSLTDNEKKKITEDLERKISIYTDFKNSETEKVVAEINANCRIIEGYINSRFHCLYQYLLSTPEYKNRVAQKIKNCVKSHDEELYRKFTEKEEEEDRYIIETLKMILELAKYGVEMENGQIRGFDLLDYYTYLNVPIDYLYRVYSRKLNYDEKVTFFKVFGKGKTNWIIGTNSHPLSDFEVNEIISMNEIVSCELCNDRLEENTGRNITRYEREMLFEYLRVNNFPITSDTYRAARSRYLNNQLYQPYQSFILERSII